MGGMENGLVNLINHLDGYRHAVIALTEVDPTFAARIQRPDVSLHGLNKPPGQTAKIFPALARLLRQLRPAIVHTRNIGTLECQVVAAWCGVPGRVHGEHGWDTRDPGGSNTVYVWQRRLCRPFVHRFIALSAEIEHYLTQRVGVSGQAVTRICNGVDTRKFAPRAAGPRPWPLDAQTSGATAENPLPTDHPDAVWFGWAGRMDPIKDPVLLAQAFALIAPARPHLRLAMIGHGPLADQVRAVLNAAGVLDRCWLPGARSDVPQCLRCLDVLVMPSRAEGISNVILEGLASGLPVVATRVGGNPELVDDHVSGHLVPSQDAQALADAMAQLADQPPWRHQAAQAARDAAVQRFSLDAMVTSYDKVYRRVMRA